jgi:hypothetical protein
VLGMLRRQMAVTIDGADAFTRWAGGDAAAARAVRDAEHQGDLAKRDLLSALREAFVTPIEPEDLFALSRGIDRILNYATDLVEESEAMASPPDEGIATIAGLRRDGGAARRRGPYGADHPPRAVPPLLADRRGRGRRRRARRLRRRQAELSGASCGSGYAVRSSDLRSRLTSSTEFLHTGWSVLVIGNAHPLDEESLLLLDVGQKPQPWPESRRALVVQLPLTMMTGRRVHPS